MLFEIGPVFLPNTKGQLPHELTRLAIALTGLRHPHTWDEDASGNYDFFDLKGIIEGLLRGLHIIEYEFCAASQPTFHPGKCALLKIGENEIGWLGELHPKVKDNYDLLEAPILAADLYLELLYSLNPQNFAVKPLGAYPPVIEDLAMIVPEETLSTSIEKVIYKTGGFLLHEVDLFDIFHGDQIGENKKSMAYRLTYQAPNRTLTDKDVGKLRDKIIKQLEKELGAKVRKAD